MNIDTPNDWKKGQTIFNFLWWLQTDKGYTTENTMEGLVKGRMADPFHIPDDRLDALYEEFLEKYSSQQTS